jgi:hypothetical protein
MYNHSQEQVGRNLFDCNDISLLISILLKFGVILYGDIVLAIKEGHSTSKNISILVTNDIFSKLLDELNKTYNVKEMNEINYDSSIKKRTCSFTISYHNRGLSYRIYVIFSDTESIEKADYPPYRESSESLCNESLCMSQERGIFISSKIISEFDWNISLHLLNQKYLPKKTIKEFFESINNDELTEKATKRELQHIKKVVNKELYEEIHNVLKDELKERMKHIRQIIELILLHKGILFGGCVRDFVFGQFPSDIDFLISDKMYNIFMYNLKTYFKVNNRINYTDPKYSLNEKQLLVSFQLFNLTESDKDLTDENCIIRIDIIICLDNSIEDFSSMNNSDDLTANRLRLDNERGLHMSRYDVEKYGNIRDNNLLVTDIMNDIRVKQTKTLENADPKRIGKMEEKGWITSIIKFCK